MWGSYYRRIFWLLFVFFSIVFFTILRVQWIVNISTFLRFLKLFLWISLFFYHLFGLLLRRYRINRVLRFIEIRLRWYDLSACVLIFFIIHSLKSLFLLIGLSLIPLLILLLLWHNMLLLKVNFLSRHLLKVVSLYFLPWGPLKLVLLLFNVPYDPGTFSFCHLRPFSTSFKSHDFHCLLLPEVLDHWKVVTLERIHFLHGFSVLILLLFINVSLLLPLLFFFEFQFSAHLLHWLADDSVFNESTLFVFSHYLY